MIATWWNQVSATAAHGLQITVVGMLLVFFTLGLVIISMVLLTKLPWLKAQKEADRDEDSTSAPTGAVSQASPVPQTTDDELAQVAAIAVALIAAQQANVATSRGSRRPHVRATGGWKLYGRAHQTGFSSLADFTKWLV